LEEGLLAEEEVSELGQESVRGLGELLESLHPEVREAPKDLFCGLT